MPTAKQKPTKTIQKPTKQTTLKKSTLAKSKKNKKPTHNKTPKNVKKRTITLFLSKSPRSDTAGVPSHPNMVFCHNGICIKPSNYGMGTFASEDIPANTELLRETPHTLDESRSSDYIYKLIRKLLDNPETRPQLESLVPLSIDPNDPYITPYESMAEGHRRYLPELSADKMRLLHTKLKRNWFSCNDRPGVLFTGTRMNHSCNPNVTYSMDGNNMVFRTTRPIKRNEEIFDSYIGTNLPYHARQTDLKQRYGFDCGCDKCRQKR